jgi:Fe-S-cluster-containing hydrogenase component 2
VRELCTAFIEEESGMRIENTKIIANAENCAGCLSCQLICSLTHQKEFNPARAFIQVEYLGRTGNDNLIYFTDDCTECGLCAQYCNYDALIAKDKEKADPPSNI